MWLKKICVFGGDLRQHYLAELLRTNGFAVSVFQVPELENTHETLAQALCGAEILALPCPLRKKEVDIESIARSVPENCTVFVGGSFPGNCRDYLQDADFLQKNAEITAEGAIHILMNALCRTVFGSRVLVVGFGRIGKALAEKLSSLGAAVFVSARKERDLQQIARLGCRALITGQYGSLAKFDCILNTVPAAVFSGDQIRQIRCPFVELASAPGGIAPDCEKPEKYISAGGLPGSYAPFTAAEAMYDAIIREIS